MVWPRIGGNRLRNFFFFFISDEIYSVGFKFLTLIHDVHALRAIGQASVFKLHHVMQLVVPVIQSCELRMVHYLDVRL